MKKIFFLKTCDTCRRIMKQLQLTEDVERHDLKEKHIDEETLGIIADKVGGYAILINKRSRQFRGQGWHEKALTEETCKAAILSHYTLLKRPILVWNDDIFVGNSKKTIDEAYQKIHS